LFVIEDKSIAKLNYVQPQNCMNTYLDSCFNLFL